MKGPMHCLHSQRFKNYNDAVEYIKKTWDVDEDTIKKDSRARKTPTLLVDLCKAVIPLYIGGSSRKLPADLESLKKHALVSRAMFEAEPALLTISILGKYGPFRDELLASYNKYMKKNGTLKNDQQVYDVIAEAVRRMPDHRLEVWRLNCGRSTSKTHGFLRVLAQIRVIKKVKRATADGLRLGASNALYVLDAKHKRAALENLKKARAAGAVLLDILHRAPKSAIDWLRLQSEALPALKKTGCPGLTSGGYNTAWSMRCALVAGHAIKKIRRMDVSGLSLRNFARMFPDQAAAVWRVGRSLDVRTVATLIKKLEYRGPPQFLSMDLCNIGALEKFDADTIKKNFIALTNIMQEYRHERGMWPVPVELLAEARRRGVDCSRR